MAANSTISNEQIIFCLMLEIWKQPCDRWLQTKTRPVNLTESDVRPD